VSRRAGLAGLVALAALLLSATSAQAVPATFWGMLPTGSISQADYNKMADAKVGTVRHDIYQQGFSFGNYDAVVGNLASRGISLLPTLKVGPGLVTPPISGSAKTNWDNFVQTVVSRYKPGGTYWSGGASSPYHNQFGAGAPDPPGGGVTQWQVFNEPSLPKYFDGSVQDYATLLKDTHDQIVGAAPGAQVVLAGLPGIVVKPPSRAWRYLNQLCGVSGVPGSFDVAALHPYAHHVWDIPPQMWKFRRVMRERCGGTKPTWISEFGYGSAAYNHRLNFGLQGQATMLRRTFNLWQQRASRWQVRGVMWYQWRDPANGNPDCSFCSSSGLLFSNGDPKPAFAAYEHFSGAGP
jgi:hypothetical protein